jgi:hypothetical protein
LSDMMESLSDGSANWFPRLRRKMRI